MRTNWARSARIVVTAGLIGCALAAAPARSNELSFPEWLADFRREAAGKGVSEPTLERALAHEAPIPRVVGLDRQHPEGTTPVQPYIARVINDRRVRTARRLLR